jgi:hypothetical protein
MMFRQYGPYLCIGIVLAILFVLWAFWGGQNYDFVGLAPLAPNTCGSYTGSVYEWGNITPATGYNPIQGQTCVPPDAACLQDGTSSQFIIDNTPQIPVEYRVPEPRETTPAIIDPNPKILTQAINQNQQLQSQQLQSQQLQQNRQPQQNQQNQQSAPIPRRVGGRFISRGERICCQTMERIYGIPFVTVRPAWLVNPETGARLELDCYNDELKIAVEYNGEQHYKWPNFINQTYEQFINQVRRDSFKMDLCDRNNVYLIVVPYNVPHDMIPSFIMSHLPETIRKRIQEEQILSNIMVS